MSAGNKTQKAAGMPLLQNIPSELFGGIVLHSVAEVHMVERCLNYRRPQRIVEIGTGTGRLSLYFGLWAACNRPCEVATIDTLIQISAQVRNTLNLLGVQCLHGDCFAEGAAGEQIQAAGTPLLLYCDGGNKVKELTECAPLLRPGDILLCHDWGTEVPPAEFGDSWCRENGLRPLWPQVFEALGCLNRAWQKKNEGR